MFFCAIFSCSSSHILKQSNPCISEHPTNFETVHSDELVVVVFQVLLVGKAAAAALSGSLSVITSVIDSAVDLVSGILMWCSGRAVKTKDTYRYPQGNLSGNK